MATVEFLYPAAGNLYGEIGNTTYLRSRLPDAFFVTDEMGREPWFVRNTPDLVIMGSMTERAQETAIQLLSPYLGRLRSLIESGCVFLATGNAWEIFTREIWFRNDDRHVPGLGLLPFDTQCDYFARNHGKVLGRFENMTIVGYHARFSQVFGDEQAMPFVQVVKGEGMNGGSKVDGVRLNNFFGTHLLGPLLAINPDFTEYLLTLAEAKTPAPADFLETAMAAKERRVAEFEKAGMKY